MTLLNRCIQGAFSFMTLYTCIKYFPLVLVSLVTNIAPLLIALFSWYFYGVGLSKLDLSVLIVSFAGVLILILGSGECLSLSKGDKGDCNDSTWQSFVNYVIPPLCLALTPMLTASIRLFTRELKTISEFTVSVYIILAMIVFYLPPVCLFYGFGFVKVFSSLDWLICALLGLTSSSL